jgi:hypothetical protein
MSIYKCPKGHESTESDYCSECGAKINGTPELVLAVNPLSSTLPKTAKSGIVCPDCTAPHEPGSGDFCEICGYNFATGGHGEIPLVPMTPTPAAEAIKQTTTNDVKAGTSTSHDPLNSNSASAGTAKQTAVVLEAIATIDPSLGEEGSPPPPSNQPPITFRLDKPSNLIGRRSDIRGIYPEVALNFDDAVSHRHALLNRQLDGTFTVRDIGSTNGTQLNGVELGAMVDIPIQDGDQLTLGHWTRLTFKVLR